MPARSNIQSTVTTKIALCAVRPDTFDQAGYESTDLVFTTIGEVESVGEHGPQAEVIKFTSVNDGVVQKLKGSTDHGSMDLTIGNVPVDGGQVIAKAAMASQNRYSARITYPTGDGESTPEKHYLDVLITQFRYVDGSANDVRKVRFMMEVCKPAVIVAAS